MTGNFSYFAPVALIIFVLLLLGAEGSRLEQSCDKFANTVISQIPARCYEYYKPLQEQSSK